MSVEEMKAAVGEEVWLRRRDRRTPFVVKIEGYGPPMPRKGDRNV